MLSEKARRALRGLDFRHKKKTSVEVSLHTNGAEGRNRTGMPRGG